MNHIRSRLIPNSKQHPDLGAAMVAGISLSPVSKHALNWCHGIGGNPVILSPEEATLEILEIVEAARKTYADDNADLANAIATAADYVKEAEALARLPVVGDETETIKGMAFLAERRAANADPVSVETRNANFLALHIDNAYGLDVARIRDALVTYQAERDRRDVLLVELRGGAAKLNAIAEKATAPATREQVAKIKADAKRLRSVPAVLTDLRQLRVDVAAISERLDGAIRQMEAVA